MKSRYILSPEAGMDMLEIWRYIRSEASVKMADRVESVILQKIVYLAGNQPAATHRRT